MRVQPTFWERYFWPLLLVLFLGLFLPLLVRDWLALKAEGLHDVEWHTTSLAELLQRDLDQHRPLPQVLARLDEPENHQQFDLHLQQKIGHLGLLMVQIYDRRGEPIYSSRPGLTKAPASTTHEFERALQGEVVSKLILPGDAGNTYNGETETTIAEVYVPVWTGDGDSPAYILEAYYDCGPILARMKRLFLAHALTLALTLLVIIGLLGWLMRSRQAMQHKVKMLEAVLPICMHCKKIRVASEDREKWVAVEEFFHRQNEVDFSHSLCQDCLHQHYPEVDLGKHDP